MKLKRFISSALAACALCTMLTTQAFAASVPAPTVGPAVGISQAILPALDEPLTVEEYIDMVCAVFAPGEDIKSPVDYCRRKGWLETIPDQSVMDKPIVRGYFYCYVLRAAGVHLYDPSLFGLLPMSPMDYSVKTLKEMGLCAEKYNSLDTISRGEALRLMLTLRQTNVSVPVPEMLKDVNWEMEEPGYMFILSALPDVPEPILDEFKAREWTLILGRTYLDSLTEELGFQAGGLTSYATKRIYLRVAESLIHEFGHFLDGVLRYTYGGTHKDEIAVEMPASASILGEYSQTNEREFFAEFFEYFINNRTNTTRMEQLRTAAPNTFANFVAMEATGWVPPSEAIA